MDVVNAQAFLAGGCQNHLLQSRDDGVDLEVFMSQADSIRVRGRHVQQVIDHQQQRLGGSLDRVGDLVLGRGLATAEQQLRHRDDAGQRGAELVAHDGEKLRLGLVGHMLGTRAPAASCAA
jgi:hypothetical protein